MPYHIESIVFSEITTELIDAWKILASKASDANPFYESWALVPALEYLDHNQIRLLCVWEDEQKSELVGLFPVERFRRFRAIPLSHIRLWKHDYCYLCSPLVDELKVESVLVELLNFLRENTQLPRVATLNWLPSSSRVGAVLMSHTDLRVRTSKNSFVERAGINLTEQTYDEYLKSLNKRKRKEWARQWRRLSELGSIEVDVLTGESTIESFESALEEFLQLEHGGWKAQQGTSLLGSQHGAEYFRAMMSAGHTTSQTVLLRVTLDNRAVGMVAAVLSADKKNIYTMKIATDPDLGKFSLGSQVIIRLTQWLFEHQSLQYADSCAAEDHPMINWLWPDRLQLGSFCAPNGNILASAAISLTDSIKPRLKRRTSRHV